MFFLYIIVKINISCFYTFGIESLVTVEHNSVKAIIEDITKFKLVFICFFLLIKSLFLGIVIQIKPLHE